MFYEQKKYGFKKRWVCLFEKEVQLKGIEFDLNQYQNEIECIRKKSEWFSSKQRIVQFMEYHNGMEATSDWIDKSVLQQTRRSR